MAKDRLLFAEDKPTVYQLSAKDVCDIIKSCKKSGVTSFRFGELDLQFGDQPKPAKPGSSSSLAEKDDEQSEDNPDLDQLMVEDPAAYERYVASLEQEDE